MKIFVAGASGALGRQLVPRLVERGDEVTGTTRTESKRALLEELGATAVVVDALDADAVGEAVAKAEPEVVVHQLTAIGKFTRNVDKAFAETNRLRTRGTDILLAAAKAAGARRVVAQSNGMVPYKRVGGPVKTEEDPLIDGEAPTGFAETLRAIKYLEAAVTSAAGVEGLVLRYGGFYGPNTSLAPGGEQFEAVRKRQMPIVGDGAGVFSFIEIGDAADATVAAIEGGAPGIYNVADDEPARVDEWTPFVADLLGVKPPRRFPRWLARLAAGPAMTGMLTEMRGISSEKAKRELGWTPAHPSWREGFTEMVRGRSGATYLPVAA